MSYNRNLDRRVQFTFQNFRKFSWWERLKILFGHNAVVDIAIRTDRRTGQCWHNAVLTLTPQLTPDDQVRQDMEKK